MTPRGAWLGQLEAIVGSHGLIVDPERLEPYSHDETSWLPPVVPAAVVLPTTTEQVARIMAACSAARVPVVPRGGGTGLSGGCRPVADGIVLGLERFDRIREISTADLTVELEPGVVLGQLHEAVEAEGLFYPPDPGSLESCTLGGNVAENAGGPRALRYGVTGHYVLQLEVVLATGEVLRLGHRPPKGVAGYDLASVIVGSEGTLAVITGLTLKLIPRPRAVATALVTFDSTREAAAAASRLLGAGILPRTLEYLDGRCMEALRPTAPFRFPEGIGAALILETDGDEEDAVLAQLARGVALLEQQGARSTLVPQNRSQQQELWTSRRQLSEAMRRLLGRKLAEDIAVPRSRIPEAVCGLAAIGERYGLLTAAYGHAGDGNLHTQVLFRDAAEQPTAARALEEVCRLALVLGGTITGEHGIGVAKREFMRLEHGPAELALMRRLKQAFDPAGILNPGKLLPEEDL